MGKEFCKDFKELRSTRQFMERTIVFCQTYQDCSNLYLYIQSTMGKEFKHPIGLPDYHSFRIIHWGPPTDIESYIQETGRAGRDGKTAQAQLLYSKWDISFSFMEDKIASYCKNTNLCRREVLFKDFEYLFQERPVGPLCCDICAIT
uniref:DNA 3'-5' helicase n=1 Tax=Amphimedon queenslandica TaxID=400682 RepID=A0A1X7VHH6_AMPQE